MFPRHPDIANVKVRIGTSNSQTFGRMRASFRKLGGGGLGVRAFRV